MTLIWLSMRWCNAIFFPLILISYCSAWKWTKSRVINILHFYLWDAMSMRLHRCLCYYSNDNGRHARKPVSNRLSNAKSFLFQSLATILFSLFIRVHFIQSLFMFIFVTIYGLNSSIAATIKRVIIIFNTQIQQCSANILFSM